MNDVHFKEVTASEVGEEYWERLGRKALPYIRCLDCGQPRTYLTRVCSECESVAFEWTTSVGRGTIYACTIVHYPPTDEFTPPYAVALVDVDEGFRVMTNILGTDGREPHIGDRVRVAFEELPDGKLLPQFVLEGSGQS